MSAYASVSDVAQEFKNVTFDSTSVITDTRVTKFITETEAIINAKVGKIYQMPLDQTASPQSTIILRRISIGMVSNRIKEILDVKTGEEDTKQAGKQTDYKSPEMLLQEIVDRKTPLPDASLLSPTNGATNYDVGDATVQHVFKVGTGRYGGPNQW